MSISVTGYRESDSQHLQIITYPPNISNHSVDTLHLSNSIYMSQHIRPEVNACHLAVESRTDGPEVRPEVK